MDVIEKGRKELILGLLDSSKEGDLVADVNYKGIDNITPKL